MGSSTCYLALLFQKQIEGLGTGAGKYCSVVVKCLVNCFTYGMYSKTCLKPLEMLGAQQYISVLCFQLASLYNQKKGPDNSLKNTAHISLSHTHF